MKTQKLFEGHERMDKEQYLIGERTNNVNNSRMSEYQWDTKSSELRRLQHQVCIYNSADKYGSGSSLSLLSLLFIY